MKNEIPDLERPVHCSFMSYVLRRNETPPVDRDRLKSVSVKSVFMVPTNILDFCKNGDCPSSIELLDHQNGKGSRSVRHRISGHLEACDFCAAELNFYKKFPQED